MVQVDWLWAALIGVGGSVVGGAVGGWYALRAGRQQWRRDRADARSERSWQAALAIAESAASLQESVLIWAAGGCDLDAFGLAANVFARAAAVQGLLLTDRDLRSRVDNHVRLVMTLASLSKVGTLTPLVQPVRLHGEALIEAIDAHVNGVTLPAYRPPPLNDIAGLIAWPSESSGLPADPPPGAAILGG